MPELLGHGLFNIPSSGLYLSGDHPKITILVMKNILYFLFNLSLF